LKNFVTQVVSDAAQNPKVATVVAATTTGSGISTYLEMIPSEIGKVATLIGIILSTVLIYTHIRLYKKKMAIMEKELSK